MEILIREPEALSPEGTGEIRTRQFYAGRGKGKLKGWKFPSGGKEDGLEVGRRLGQGPGKSHGWSGPRWGPQDGKNRTA